IIGADIVGSDIQSRQYVPIRIHGRSGRAEGAVPATNDVTEEPSLRGVGVNGATQEWTVKRVQQLHVDEEEGLVLEDGPTNTAAIDVLDELSAAVGKTSGDLAGFGIGCVGIKKRTLVEPPSIAMELVCAGLGDHEDLAAGIATVFSSEAAGEDTKLREGIRILTSRRKLRAASAGLIGVDSVEGVVPCTIA